jgi:multimeric flavodoxin WrbA
MSETRVTALCGSPRKGGNTEIILRKMLEGAASKGAEIVFRDLNSMKIRPCQACNSCKDGGSQFCAIADEMQTVYSDIRDSQAVIIGSPIYMWQMTAQTKAVIDRLYAILLPGFESKIGSRKLALVFTQGAPEGSFKDYIDGTAKMLRMLKFEVVSPLVAAGTEFPGSVSSEENLMKKAFDTGASLV